MENIIEKNTIYQNATLFVLRIIIAIIFLYAGIAKWPFWSVTDNSIPAGMLLIIKFLSIVEPLGALALILGILTRWAAAGMVIIMIGAIIVLVFTMNTSFFTQPQAPGWDYNLLILGGSLAIAAFGAGRWSVDYLMKR